MKKIVVLEGGLNEEHEVSINSSKQIQKALINLNYDYEVLSVNPMNFEKKLKEYNGDFLFFNSLHGPYGEDGEIQRLFEKYNLYYTHSNSLTSALAFDKILTKSKLSKTEIKFPKSIPINKLDINYEKFKEFYQTLNKFVLKPVGSGSSFGVRIFASFDQIDSYFQNYTSEINLYKDHDNLMIEKYIEGKELTVGVLEKNNNSISMAVTEILYENQFYDYKAKYTEGKSQHIIPARISKDIYDRSLNLAKIAHDKLECRGLSRSDFIFDGKDLFFLEINTQPGLTLTSLVPEQSEYIKISFENLINSIIHSSL